MARLLGSTRLIVIFGVAASLVLSAGVFISGLVRTALLVADALLKLDSDKTAKSLSIGAIELADMFLIATALYIVGIGLYELFIGPVDLPEWLVVSSLDDLKDKLINVVVVVLAVNFLARISNWDGVSDMLAFGASIAIVIAALSVYGLVRRNKQAGASKA